MELKELLVEYVNKSYEELLEMAKYAIGKTYELLADMDQENVTRMLIFFLAASLGSDGQLTALERKFVAELLNADPNGLDQLMEGGRSPEVLELVDNLFDSAPQELKPVLLMYVTAFVCVDESVNRGEFEFVQRLLA